LLLEYYYHTVRTFHYMFGIYYYYLIVLMHERFIILYTYTYYYIILYSMHILFLSIDSNITLREYENSYAIK